MVTKNLNKVIDRNYYPLEEARRSNMRHRPVGLGVQGLADVFLMMKMPFESDAWEIRKNKFHWKNTSLSPVFAVAFLSFGTGSSKSVGKALHGGRFRFHWLI